MADVRVQEAGSIRVSVGDRIEDLDTPLILADLDQMERNIADWQSWMDARGVKFRVHIKTHKVPEIALLQLAAGARGICCAKVSEAEPFAAAGVDDIALAYPIFGEEKWARVAQLAASGVRMTANCDSDAGARQASAAGAAAGVTLNLQIDLESGMYRGGVPAAELDRIETLARTIAGLPGVEFDGLTTHRSYFFEGKRSRQEEGHAEGELIVGVAEALRARGIEVREVNAGARRTAPPSPSARSCASTRSTPAPAATSPTRSSESGTAGSRPSGRWPRAGCAPEGARWTNGSCCTPCGGTRASRWCAARTPGCGTPTAACTWTRCRARPGPRWSGTPTRGWRRPSRGRWRRCRPRTSCTRATP
jgi:hypothetical protein